MQATRIVFGSKYGLENIGYLGCRTQFLDQIVLNSAPTQLVILGAGMDTRCHRLELDPTCRCFEIDAAFTQTYKHSIISKRAMFFTNSSRVTYVPVNFEEEDFFDALVQNGFDPKLQTTFILEGVSYYLTKVALFATLSKIRKCSHRKTIIAFDFATDYWTEGSNSSVNQFTLFLRRIGEPFLFGMPPKSTPMETFGTPLGFTVDVWLGPWTFQDKYLGDHFLSSHHNLVMNLAVMSVA